MRLGISTKLTQPGLRGAEEEVDEIVRIPLALNITTDTWHGPNSKEGLKYDGTDLSDGRYYNIAFPHHFVKWSAATYTDDGTGAGGTNQSGAIPEDGDPFADYREAGDNTRNNGNILGYPTNGGIAPPINANLDITITVPSGTYVGSSYGITGYSVGVTPSIILYASVINTMESSFTEEAAKNLKITIINEGYIGGGGGVGGYGAGTQEFASKQREGGAGGGGAGIHPASPALYEKGDTYINPGAGAAAVFGQAGDGAAGETPARLDSANQGGAGGTGFAGNYAGAGTTASWPFGWNGGDAIILINPLAYYNNGSEAWAGDWATGGTYSTQWQAETIGPEVHIQNNDGGEIHGGAGGGGGGGATNTPATGGDGGDGGDLGEDGEAGVATAGANAGVGGFEGKAISKLWPFDRFAGDASAVGFRNVGKITTENNNLASGSFSGQEGNH